MTEIDAIREAERRAGSQSALARMAGVSQTSVWRWWHGRARVAPEAVLAIETGTGVSRHSLRPDIYPPLEPELPMRRLVGAR
jgi:DNA-binding transcriptional regulator YdaS (Cro superfamily)